MPAISEKSLKKSKIPNSKFNVENDAHIHFAQNQEEEMMSDKYKENYNENLEHFSRNGQIFSDPLNFRRPLKCFGIFTDPSFQTIRNFAPLLPGSVFISDISQDPLISHPLFEDMI